MIFGLSVGWWIAIGYIAVSIIGLTNNIITRIRDPVTYKAHYENKNMHCPTTVDLVKLFIFNVICSFVFGAGLTYFFG